MQLYLAVVLVEPERFVGVLVAGHDGTFGRGVGSRRRVVSSVINRYLARILFLGWELELRHFSIWYVRDRIRTSCRDAQCLFVVARAWSG